MPLKVTADPQRFDEAIEDLRKRVPMTKAEWEELEQRARARAFTVAGIAQLDVLNDTKKSLVDALEHGQTLEEWKKEAGERLESEWQGSVANPAARLETIYRTNLQTAYSRGHEIQASHPAVQRYRPYKRFIATMDVDTTDVCREAHGTVLPADHPWWNDHTPPLHFNCRSTVETLSEEEALELGLTEAPTDLPASEGFGAKPELDQDPALEKWAAEKLEAVDAELAEIYRAKEEARVQAEERARKEAEAREAEREAAEAQARKEEEAREKETQPRQSVRPPEMPPQQYLDEAKRRWSKWERELLPAESRALREYTGVAHGDLNQALRRPAGISSAELDSAERFASELDSALAKSEPLREPVTVFRGSDFYAKLFERVGDLGKLKGQILRDAGFTSTSSSELVASGFGSVVAEIRLPAGVRVGFMEPTTEFDGELEVLLPRNATFRILDAWTDAEGKHHLVMELDQ